LKYLRGRDGFEAQVRAKCRAAGASEGAIAAVIAFLSEKKVIDDMRVAGSLAEKLSLEKAWAKERIRADLECRGASPESVDLALEPLPPDSETARRFVEKHRAVEAQNVARRMSAAGYDAETIRAMVAPD